MDFRLIPLIFLLGTACGCATQSSVRPVEALDERTGVTLGALKKPIELVPGTPDAVVSRKRATFAYLGPVEWNRSGDLTYGLWIHIAPGSDRPLGDIRGATAPTLILDDGPVVLSRIEAPQLGRYAYRPVVSWGQAAYFDLTVATLRRMAASRKLELDVAAVDGSTMSFIPTLDTRTVLAQYLQDRGLTGD
jgi:hypothetical protein